MKGRESSGDGRVMPKAKGTGGSHGKRMSKLRLLPKDPSQPDLGLTETPSIPGRGPSRCGQRACGQGSQYPTAESMDKIVQSTVYRKITIKHLAGRLPLCQYLFNLSHLRCPPKPNHPSCVNKK